MSKAENPNFDRKVLEILFIKPNATVHISGGELTREEAVKQFRDAAAMLDDADCAIITSQGLEGLSQKPKREIKLPIIY